MREVTNETISMAAAGDTAAFEIIYRAHAGLIYNTTFRLLGNREDAQETTQEVFLTVYRKLPSFAHRASLTTWIYRIAVNQAINHLRKHGAARQQTVEFDERIDERLATSRVEDRLEHQAREKIVAGLLARLSPEQRTCIVLRNLEGLSYEDIAATLQVNINTVRSRLKRAREKLMAMGRKRSGNGL